MLKQSKIYITLCILILLVYTASPLHALTHNATGKGVVVAVIDTGADTTHPDLKDNIIGGYDFVENKPIYKDGDERKGHGSHVSGIIAANGKQKGIAPEASLLIYRVVDENDAKTDAYLEKAIYQAIEDGADIINISMRSNNVNPNSTIVAAVEEALAQNILVVKAAGNYGPEPYSIFGLAASDSLITVGNSMQPTPMLRLTLKDNTSITLQPMASSPDFKEASQSELVKIEPSNHSTELKGKLVAFNELENIIELVPFLDHLAKEGASGALMISDFPSPIRLTTNGEKLPLPIAYITPDAYAGLEKSDTFKLTTVTKQLVSEDSSRGPAYGNFILKPDLVAQGVQILSTVPLQINDSGYAYDSGTSMASPYVAGAAALIMEAHPDWTAAQVKSALVNTAIPNTDLNDEIYPVTTQGAGGVAVSQALNTAIAFDEVSLSTYVPQTLTPADQTFLTNNVSMTNLTDSTRSYKIAIAPDSVSSSEVVSIQETITLPAHGKVTLPVTFEFEGKPESGRLIFTNTSDSKDRYIVPYLVATDSKDLPLIKDINESRSWLSHANPATTFSFYLPTQIDKVNLTLENIQQEDAVPLSIYQGYHLSSGAHTTLFDSSSLKDGLYSVAGEVKNKDDVESIDGGVLIVDHTAPTAKIKQTDTQVTVNAQDFMLDYPYIAEKENLIPVTAQWQSDKDSTWHTIDLDPEGAFTLSRSTVGSSSLTLKLTDAAGNHSIVTVPALTH